MRSLIQILTALALSASANAQIVGESDKLVPGDAAPGDDFAAAIAIDGDRAVFGSIRGITPSGEMSGSIYSYDMSSGTSLREITPSDGQQHDFFGYSVALDGTRALVGAPGDDLKGSAYLIDLVSGQELLKIVSPLPDNGASFGWSVALSGEHAIVGAPNHHSGGTSFGCVYVFDAASGQLIWVFESTEPENIFYFGMTLAVDGETLLVGAPDHQILHWAGPGAAYVYDLSTLTLKHILTPSDGVDEARFGLALALDGGVALIGAPTMDDFGWATGAAYLYDLSTGQETAKLMPLDASAEKLFGSSVAVSNGRAVVGAQWDNAPNLQAGSAYVFDVATGQQTAKLVPSDSMGGNGFGISAALQGDRLLIGAEEGDIVPHEIWNTGAAYLFDLLDLGSAYCFGDGSGVLCTCGLLGNPGEGCGNSSGEGGARLLAAGAARISEDSFQLHVSGVPGNKPGLILRGADQTGGGLGTPLGDGLLCTSGQTARSQVQVTLGGTTLFTDFQGGPFGASSYGAGVTANYQFWYRDADNACSGSNFNFSNAWEVTWQP